MSLKYVHNNTLLKCKNKKIIFMWVRYYIERLKNVTSNFFSNNKKNVFDNFYIITKICCNEKRHYILPVCHMACLNLW